MESISFSNFKRFKQQTTIEFGKVTFLVGTNNAGKSTVNTALDFLTFNFKKMGSTNWVNPMPCFKIPNELGEYGRIHNKYSNDALEFSSKISEFILSFEFNEAKEKDKSVSVKKICIEDLMRGYKLTATSSSTTIEWFQYDEFDYPESWKEVVPEDDLRQESLPLDYLITYIEDNIRDYKQSGASYDELESMHSYLDSIYEKAVMLRNSRVYEVKISNSFDYTNTYKLERSFIANDPINDNLVTPYLLSNSLISISKFWKCDFKSANIPTYVKSRIQSSAYSLEHLLNNMNVQYLPVHMLEKTTVFLPSHPLYDLIDRFYKRNESMGKMVDGISQEEERLLGYLEIFGVAKDIRINSIGGVAYTLELKTPEGEWFHLSDMGTGILRIMELSLFFQLLSNVVYLGGNGSKFILIEEPEQNLHPKYQSLLCDFFQLASRKTGYKIVVETHSEYLIRRSQVLVAENKYNNEIELEEANPFKVYYFPENDIPYEMVYKINGYFEQSFGSGFFDEASKWSRQLMRINNN